MSKAFKSDDGDNGDLDDLPEVIAPIPGGKNYITPAGFKRMQQELIELKTKTRPEVTQVVSWAAGNGDRSENGDYIYGKKRLREIDKRIHFLSKRIESAEIADPLLVTNKDQVLFGATVTIRNEDDQEKTYTIVGIDETDMEKFRISWISPIATALLKSHVGDVVQFRSPKGLQEIEIVSVKYLAVD